MAYFPHEFTAPLQAHGFGKSSLTVVYLPDDLHEQLPLGERPRLRVEAEIAPADAAEAVENRTEHCGAFQPSKHGYYLMLGKKTQRAAGVQRGDLVRVRFRVADPDSVDVPEELQTALDGDDDARAVWVDSTAGRKRGLAYRVSSAKRPETRAKRVAEVIKELQADA